MKIKKSFYSIIFPLSLLFLHTIVCSDNIRVKGSYKSKKLICNEFKIGDDCIVSGDVKADTGTVDNSMNAYNIVMRSLKVGSSLKVKNVTCDTFKIGNNCVVNGDVNAGKGTVDNSMNAYNIVMRSLKVGSSLKVNNVTCDTFKIGNNCIVSGDVKADTGTVDNSMTAQNIDLIESLNVGGNLKGEALVCPKFKVDSDCIINGNVTGREGFVGGEMKVHNIELQKYLNVLGSLTVHGQGRMSDLTVGQSLFCLNTTIANLTQVGNIIQAKNSNFNKVYMKDSRKSSVTQNFVPNIGNIVASGGSSVNIAWSSNIGNIMVSRGSSVNIGWSPTFYLSYVYAFAYYMSKKIMSLFLVVLVSQDLTFLDDREISNFDNCTVDSIFVDKKDKSQVFNLRDTVVQGDIQFAKGTKGEVHLFGNAKCLGTVVNGTVYNHTQPVILDESSVKQHGASASRLDDILKNASAPS